MRGGDVSHACMARWVQVGKTVGGSVRRGPRREPRGVARASRRGSRSRWRVGSRARIAGARTLRGWRTPADAPACPPRRDLSPRIPRSWPWWRCSTPPRGGGPGSWPRPSPWRRAPSRAARTATSSRMDGRARASFTVTPPRRVSPRSVRPRLAGRAKTGKIPSGNTRVANGQQTVDFPE